MAASYVTENDRDAAAFTSVVESHIRSFDETMGSLFHMPHPDADPTVAKKSLHINENVWDPVGRYYLALCVVAGTFPAVLVAGQSSDLLGALTYVGLAGAGDVVRRGSNRRARRRLREFDAEHGRTRLRVPRTIKRAYENFAEWFDALPGANVPDAVLADAEATRRVMKDLLIAADDLRQAGKTNSLAGEQIREQMVRHAGEARALVTIARERADIIENAVDVTAVMEASTTRSLSPAAHGLRAETTWLAKYLEDPTAEKTEPS